jgi:voltage-gated potassium channel
MGFISAKTLKFRIVLLTGVVLILLTIGTFFYSIVEGWSTIDSLYMSAISLSTRGYGDLHPVTVAGKIFTIFYLFIGVTFILYLFSSFVAYYMEFHEPMIRKRVDKVLNKGDRKDKWVTINIPSDKK